MFANLANLIVVASAEGGGGPLSVNSTMVLWTWITFGLVSFLLYKKAWKPVLSALDAREDRVRQSIDDADRVADELAQIEQKRAEMLAEAEAETKRIIAEARAGASEVAATIEQRAAEKAKIQYENAERDIKALRERAVSDMHDAQVDLVVDLAGKLVSANMDTEKNRALTDQLIAEMKQ